MSSFTSGNGVAEKAALKTLDSGATGEVGVDTLNDSDEDSNRKRSRAYSMETTASDRKIMRGNYRCSRCNKPKKGHKW